MEKSACEYVVPRGERRGQKCGNACVRKEGEEPHCFRHKPKYLASKNVNPHATKDQQIADLNDLSRLQQMQIQSIITELENCRTELFESKSMCNSLEKKSVDQQQQIEMLNNRIKALTNEMTQIRLVNEKMQQENSHLKTDIDRCLEEVTKLAVLKNQFELLKANCPSPEKIGQLVKEVKCERDRASKFEQQLDELLNQYNTLYASQEATRNKLIDLSTKFTKFIDVFKSRTKEVVFPKLKQYGEEIKRLAVGMERVKAILDSQD